MTNDALNPQFKQRGRASMKFLTHLFRGSDKLRRKADADIAELAGEVSTLPENLNERARLLDKKTQSSSAVRVKRLIGDWHARNHAAIATQAFEEFQPEIEKELSDLENGPASLFLDKDLKAPAYWKNVEFHRTEGGWDGHEYAGYIHGELIHRKMVNDLFDGNIFQMRKKVASRAPKEEYKRILDMGCSTGHFTVALAESYPSAEIVGVDLSQRALEHCHRVANAKKLPWKLYQRPAEKTGFDANSFDLVASYILLHEVPARIIKALFKEAYRVLEPGGDLLMSDVTRYADMDKLSVWKADNAARFGGEPHWRASASLDLGELAREVGFVDVTARGDAPMAYPHVVQGRKP